MIVELARKDGVAEHSVADLLLTEWLEKKPSETFFYDTLLAIRAVLLAIPRERADARRNEIISRAKAVAAAPEGIVHQGAEILETLAKLKAGEEIYAPHREHAVLQRIGKLNKGPIQDESLQMIYREIM